MDTTMMQTVLTIYDWFPVDGGTCLVGVNADLNSLTDAEIVERIGSTVVLRRYDMVSRPISVLGVDSMTSLENKKNIALKFNGEIPNEFLEDGTEVCRVTE